LKGVETPFKEERQRRFEFSPPPPRQFIVGITRALKNLKYKKMNLSNYLAELWGITFVAVSLALLIKPKLLERLFAEVENEATMFFWGTVSLVIGIAVVLAHNVWVPDWRVVITILGWLSLIRG
jgi:hypothetical protein